jgi:iron-sulfur cluster repair protein YtfE (RIC family)
LENSFYDFFHKDHQRIRGIFDHYQDSLAKDKEHSPENLRTLKQSLHRHILWEDRLIFPIFEAESVAYLANSTKEVRREHGEILNLLSAMTKRLEQKGFSGPEEAALETLLESHTFKEEHIIYPYIDQHVTRNEREMVFRNMRKIDAEIS